MSDNKKLGNGAITTGGGTLLYTVPTGYKTTVTNIDICNTTSGSLTAIIYLVPTGGSIGTSNMLFPTVTIAGNTMVQWTGEQTLNAGDFIQGIGSSAGITVNITGQQERI